MRRIILAALAVAGLTLAAPTVAAGQNCNVGGCNIVVTSQGSGGRSGRAWGLLRRRSASRTGGTPGSSSGRRRASRSGHVRTRDTRPRSHLEVARSVSLLVGGDGQGGVSAGADTTVRGSAADRGVAVDRRDRL